MMIVTTPYAMFEKSAIQFTEKPALVFEAAAGDKFSYSYGNLLTEVMFLARRFSNPPFNVSHGGRVCFLTPFLKKPKRGVLSEAGFT